jgi:hypothetical protein
MAKDPAFLFYDGDAARDVSHMNRLERGCYFDFVQAQKKFGPLTIDAIKKILGKDFDSCWPALNLILTYDNDMYYIAWLKDSIEKRQKYSEGRSKNRKGSKQPENKESKSTYVNHMVNENVNAIENENFKYKLKESENRIEEIEDKLKEYDTWTTDIIDGNDQYFETMFMRESIPAGEHIQFWIMDHRDLLNRYPKMRPPTQDAFRKSCLKHIRENYKKPINGKSGTSKKQQQSDSTSEYLKNYYAEKISGSKTN